MAPSTWIVTGCSSGLGEQIVKKALAHGDRVIAATRNAHQRLQHLKEAGAALLDFDTTWSPERLHSAAQEAIAIYGSIDIIVNNAGYIDSGAAEQLSQDTLLLSLHTNALGPLAFTQALLSHLREKRSGTVLFIGSVGPYMGSGLSGSTAYNSTKCYMEGVAQAMYEELVPWNIRVCVAVSGFLRTEIFGRNIKTSTLGNPDSAYRDFNQGVRAVVSQIHGNESGDPAKAAALIVDVMHGENQAAGKKFPFRFPIGDDAIAILRARAKELNDMCDTWESAASVGFVE